MKKEIIACQIFTDELPAVLPEEYKDIEIVWLDAGLHCNLDAFTIALSRALKDAVTRCVDARILFGSGCHPDMCHLANVQGGKNLGVKNCIEAFCHDDNNILEQNRTMAITPGWVRFFSNIMEGAGWDDVDVRQNFGRYDRILLLDTGIKPLSEEEILEFYELVQVPIEIQPIDLDHFRARLVELLAS